MAGQLSNSVDRLNGVLSSLAVKAPCKAVAIANITLSGEQTVNGIAVVTGDRVLVTAQTDAKENGIYCADTSAWSRAPDFDGNRDIVKGTMVLVANPSGSGRSFMYEVSSNDPLTIGSSDINFLLVDDPNVTYDQTAAEATLSITPADNGIRPPSLYGTGLRYGLSESNADIVNGPNLQDFFNVVRQGKSNLAELPPGEFDIAGPVYPYYDATGNPVGPSHIGQALHIKGAGAPSRRSLPDTLDYHGTVLNFTNASGGGLIVGNGTDALHTVIEDMGFIGGMSDELLYLRGLARHSLVRNLFVGMTGTGYGIRTFSSFTMGFSVIDMWGDNGTPQGIGFYLDTSQGSGGGNILFDQITASFFDVGLRFGSPYNNNNVRVRSAKWVNCQGRGCATNNIEFLNSVEGQVFTTWSEGANHDIGILIADHAGPLEFKTMELSGTKVSRVAEIQIGRSGGSIDQCSVGGLIFDDASFNQMEYDGILHYSPPKITNVLDVGGVIRVQFDRAHGLSTGRRVFIEGVVGTTEANGSWVITSISTTVIQLDGSTFTNAYVGGGHCFTTHSNQSGIEIHSPRISNNGGYFFRSDADSIIGGLELDDVGPNANAASPLSVARYVVDSSNNRAEYLVTRGGRGLERYSLVCAGGGSGSPDLDMRGWLEAPAVPIRCATTGGGGYIYLPDPPKIGSRIKVFKDNAANDVVIDPGAVNSISGFSSTLTLESDGDFAILEFIEDDVWVVVASRITASVTWDPGSIPDGDEAATTVTLSGVELGQHVVASFSLDVTDLVLDAQVTAANTVTAVLANNTNGAIDLASGTLLVRLVT